MAPEKGQSKTKILKDWDKTGIIFSQTDWSPPSPCAKTIDLSPEPMILAFITAARPDIFWLTPMLNYKSDFRDETKGFDIFVYIKGEEKWIRSIYMVLN